MGGHDLVRESIPDGARDVALDAAQRLAPVDVADHAV
jgi:hypothetical protein